MKDILKSSFDQVMAPAVGMSRQQMQDYLQALSNMVQERKSIALFAEDESVELIDRDADEELLDYARFSC